MGTRRALLAPAVLTPAPPGMMVDASASHKAERRKRPPPEMPPPPPADDIRAVEREKQAELACRRLWIAANANDGYLREELHQLKEELAKTGAALTSQAIMAKMKSTQVCAQMNKARKEGAKVDWRSPDWDGATLLIKAVRTNSVPLAMHMIAIGADTSVLDNSGRGLLHWCAIEGNHELLSFVFDVVQELQIDEPDDGGDTPLHLAAYHGHLPAVRMLVRRGAEALRQNACGFTPCELAESRRKWHVVTYLCEYKLLQEDQANERQAKLIDLVRPCNQARATQVWKLAKAEGPPKK